jgi:hypothetical protein
MKFEIYGDRLDLADELEDDFRKEARAVVREGVDMLIAETKANLQKLMNGKRSAGGPSGLSDGRPVPLHPARSGPAGSRQAVRVR